MAEIKIFTFNIFREHTMVVWKEAPSCIIVDPGFYTDDERDEFFNWFKDKGVTPEAIIITHGHVDHIWGVVKTQEAFGGIPIYMSAADEPELELNIETSRRLGLRTEGMSFGFNAVADGDILELAGMRFKAISTPGHTPGGICYLEENEGFMLTGDTLFAGTIGRTDLKTSDYDDLIRSIMEKLIWLDGDIEIFPGHGGPSTIFRERSTNPFLEPFNEKEELSAEES